MTKRRPVLVAVVGGSGSGKTWLAERLEKSLGKKVLRLSLDDFYLDRSHLPESRREKLNFDRPAAIDWPLFKFVLRALAEGKTARGPTYDFALHARGKRVRVLNPRPLIIVDGLWLLHFATLRRIFDLRIFLDCCAGTRLERRLERDQAFRGRTELSVRQQFQKMVQPMHRKYVGPQKRWADLVIEESCPEAQIGKVVHQIRQLLQH